MKHTECTHHLRFQTLPPSSSNTLSDPKHHLPFQTPLLLPVEANMIQCRHKIEFLNCVSLFNIRGVNQKHYYTLVKFGRMLPNFFQEVVEFKSNTPRAEALGVFDLNSTTSLKKFGSILPNFTSV